MGNKAVKSAKELVKICIEGLDELTANGADERATEQVGQTIHQLPFIEYLDYMVHNDHLIRGLKIL